MFRTVTFCVLTALRQIRVLPSYTAHLYGVDGDRLGSPLPDRRFWTKDGALYWADQQVSESEANIVAIVSGPTRLGRSDEGKLVSLESGITTISKEGYEVEFREDDVYVVPSAA
jgi:hypothetical protein